MKIAPFLNTAWLAIGLFALAACSRELPGEEPLLPDGKKEMRLSVVVPGSAPASTRAIGDTEENTIRTVDVLAYRINGVNETFEYWATGTPTPENTAGSATQTFISNLHVEDYPQRLVIITNAHDQVNALIAAGNWTGADKATMLAELRYDLSGNQDRWNATSPASFAALPMWGESSPETITSATKTLSASVSLMRMVARIDVQLDATVAGLTDQFKLKSIALYNTNTGGRIVPDASKVIEEQRDATRYLRVSAPSVPTNLQPYAARHLGPINYTDFAAPGVTDVSMLGAIYTFESTATASPDNQATCLVVGGFYGTDQTQTYYRVEFYAAGTQTRLDLLRNNRYVVNITRVGGRGHASLDEAFRSTAVNMTASILVWNHPELDNILIGENIVATDKNTLSLYGNAYNTAAPTGENTLSVFTDYSSGWKVDRIVDAANGTTPVEWLSISPQSGAAGATVSTVVNATLNTTGALRSAIIYLSAGRLSLPIRVNQSNMPLLSLEIVNNSNQSVADTELIFSGTAGVAPASQLFTVKWQPSNTPVSVTVTPTGQAFPIGSGAPQSGTFTNDGGAQSFIVSPPALTNSELAGNPFLRKSSNYTFSVTSGSTTVTNSITLTQLRYTTIPYLATNYTLNGSTNAFSVQSNNRWQITSIVQRPVKAGAPSILNNQYTDNLAVGTTGGPNTSGSNVSFTTSTTPGYNWGAMDVTFSSADPDVPAYQVTSTTLMAARPLRIYGINVGDGRYSIWQTAGTGGISENLNTMNMLGATPNFGLTATSKVITQPLVVNGTRFDNNPIPLGIISTAAAYDIIFFTGANWTDEVAAAINNQLLVAGKTVVVFCEDKTTLRSLMNAVFGTTVGGRIYYSDDLSSNDNAATFRFRNNNDPLLNGIFSDLRGRCWGNDGGFSTTIWNLPPEQTEILSSAENQSGANPTNLPANLTMQNSASAFRLKNVAGKNLIVFLDGGFAGTRNTSNMGGSPDSDPLHWPASYDLNTWAPIPKTYGVSPQQQIYNSAMIANIVAWAAARNPQ